jgi:small conductance mechanosensitive channel
VVTTTTHVAPTASDTLIDFTPLGRAAERLVHRDSLAYLPHELRGWWTNAWASVAHSAPRLVLALVLGAVVIVATWWLRNVARRWVGPREQRRYRRLVPRQIATGGLLFAGVIAAAVGGAPVIAAALLVFLIYYMLAATLTGVGGSALRHSHVSQEASELALTVGRYALLTLGATEAFRQLGFNVGGVIAGLGILGIAVGFAAQDTLANLIAGFTILWDRPLRVGDWVKIGDGMGQVRQITLRTTRIETVDSGILVIPNKDVTGSKLNNYSLRALARVRVAVEVPYSVDPDLVHSVLLGVVPDDPVISRSFAPAVAVTELTLNGVRHEVVFFVTTPTEQSRLKWLTNERILRAFREHGIPFAAAQMVVQNSEKSEFGMRAG